MKCDEAQSLHDAYIDSELDARTTLEVEWHLKSCGECERFFAEAQRFEAWVRGGLKRGVKSGSLWQKAEQGVMATAEPATVFQPAPSVVPSSGWWTRWRVAPRAWGALAAAWSIILVLNLGARDSDSSAGTGRETPSVSQMRFAFKQKQWLLAQLAMPSEPERLEKAGASGPRSQLRKNDLENLRWL